MRNFLLSLIVISAALSAFAQALHPKIPTQPVGNAYANSASVVAVEASVMETQLLTRTEVELPKDLQDMEGTVTLEALIDDTGHVIQLRAIDGPTMLRQFVIEAVQQWSYRPFTMNGRPAKVSTRIIVQIKKP